MAAKRDKNVPVGEKVISTAMLILLAVVVAGIVGGGFLKGPTPASGKGEISYPLPEGWSLDGGWEVYPRGRLYEKIDGREPLFEEYGVIRLESASATTGGQAVEVYIYTMADADGALGIYLANMPMEFEEADAGSMADISGGQARAFQGQTYLEIMSLAKESDPKRLISLAANLLKHTVKEGKTSQGVFELLPSESRIRGSLALNRDNTFGLKSLTNTFTASYENDDVFFDYLLRKLTSTDEGETILKNVQNEIVDFGGTVFTAGPDRLDAEFLGKKLFLRRQGLLLIGVYGEMSRDDAAEQLEILRKRVNDDGKQ
jgi:hypothetical protein